MHWIPLIPYNAATSMPLIPYNTAISMPLIPYNTAISMLTEPCKVSTERMYKSVALCACPYIFSLDSDGNKELRNTARGQRSRGRGLDWLF